jgi:hypothetical protein
MNEKNQPRFFVIVVFYNTMLNFLLNRNDILRGVFLEQKPTLMNVIHRDIGWPRLFFFSNSVVLQLRIIASIFM